MGYERYSLLDPDVDEIYHEPWQRAFCGLMALIDLLIFIFSSFVMWMILKNKLQGVQNLLLFNVLLTDWTLSVINFPIHTGFAVTGRFFLNDHACQFQGIVITILCCQAILAALLLSLERYAAIVSNHPLTVKRTQILMGMTWGLSIVLSTVCYWFDTKMVVQPSLSYCAPNYAGGRAGHLVVAWACFTICTLNNIGCGIVYWRIFAEIRSKRIYFQELRRMGTITDAKEIAKTRQEEKANEVERKVTIKFAIIVGTLLVNWATYNTRFGIEPALGKEMPAPFDAIAICGSFFNSLCNPVILLILDQRIRKTAEETIGWTVWSADSSDEKSGSTRSRSKSLKPSQNATEVINSKNHAV
ncbi:hypothetical protein BC832DRAFT_170640 [Gaertneriomyces semiglobifer]|nr:hypothetical protein BC832DRAFT_170640 [Gaertneriomyces semiglobifer]